MRRKHRDADADIHIDSDSGVFERLSHHSPQSIRASERLGNARRVLQQDRELVSAQAGDDGIARPRAQQARAQCAQQRVAGHVPKSVVDFLEAIQIEQHHDQAALFFLRALQQFGERAQDMAAIAQTRQLVRQGLLTQVADGLHLPARQSDPDDSEQDRSSRQHEHAGARVLQSEQEHNSRTERKDDWHEEDPPGSLLAQRLLVRRLPGRESDQQKREWP